MSNYFLHAIDGFLKIYLNLNGSSYKTARLVKDRQVARYFENFGVSNYDELYQSLKNVEFPGNF